MRAINSKFVLMGLLFVRMGGGALTHGADVVEPELTRLERKLAQARTQYELNVASGDLASYWDRELEKIEVKLLLDYDEDGAAIFRTAQKAWRAFRAAEVARRGDEFRGGSMQPLIVNSTYAEMTKKRCEELPRTPEFASGESRK